MKENISWIKIAENGAIGEARTKSFLLNRFWILERSIDINGADFIIQRRLQNKSLLDRNAPKLGFVQSKFVSNKNTNIYIHRDYILDKNNQIMKDFFLIIHTGDEQTQKIFFMTSNDIVNDFKVKEIKGQGKYYIPGKIILEEKYLVKDRKYALNSIEQSLKDTDFIKNRDHYKWTQTRSNIDMNNITSDFKIPVDNNWGSIPESILSMKEAAFNTLQEIETVSSILQNLIEEEDPIIITEYAEDLYYKCGSYPKPSITISEDIYSNEDLDKAVLNHKRVISEIRSKNKINEYIINLNLIKESFSKFLVNNNNLNSKSTHKCIIKISKEDFKILKIDNELVEEVRKSEIIGDELLYYWKPLEINYGGKSIENTNERILENCKYECPMCMVELLKYCLEINVYNE